MCFNAVNRHLGHKFWKRSKICPLFYKIVTAGLLSTIAVYILNDFVHLTLMETHYEEKNLSSILSSLQERIDRRLQLTPLDNKERCLWPPKNLYGRRQLNRTELGLEILINIYTYMKYGHYKPSICTPYQRVAVIVPYRDREMQLRIFLNNVIDKLHRQQLEFGIYVIEQTVGTPFNRGMLSNIGYKEAMLDLNYDCVVIHDVDILPEDDRNLYICADNPIHMATKVQQFRYGLPYHKYAGGVTTFSRRQYETINGFSNQFFGWGGEDDELFIRINQNNYSLIRPFTDYGYCGSLRHRTADKTNNRMSILRISHRIRKKDGLNNLNYEVIQRDRKALYMWIYVNIDMQNVTRLIQSFGISAMDGS